MRTVFVDRPSRTTCRAWSSPASAASSPLRGLDAMLEALTTFLAPYRDGSAAADKSKPDATAAR